MQISWIFTFAIATRTIAGPAWGAFADHHDRHRRTTQALAVGALLTLGVFLLPLGLGGAILFMGLSSVCFPPIISLLEGTTITWCRALGADYGRVRLWGSLAFLTAGATAGSFLVGRSREWILVLILILAGAVVGASFLLPPQRHREPGPHISFRSLFGVRSFALLLLATAFIQGSHGAYYTFSSIHWEDCGISRGTIGLLWAEGVGAEVVLFAFAGRFLRMRPSTLLACGALGAGVRWTVLADTSSVPLLAAAQLLHGLSFGATHLAGVRWISRHVPHARTVSALALLGAVSAGLGPGLATPLAGALYERSPSYAFLAMSALATVGLALALTLRLRRPPGARSE